MAGEEWRPLSWKGREFGVSSMGRVWRMPFVDPRGCLHRAQEAQPTKTSAGYLVIGVGGGRVEYVHRMVCAAFSGLEPGMLVRHLNDRRDDNRAENLAQGTGKDNSEDARRNGRLRTKLSPAAVAQIRKRRGAGETYKSIASDYGCTPQNIFHVCSGSSWAGV